MQEILGSVDTDNFRVYKRFSIFSFPFQLLADENIPTCAVCEIVVKGLGVIRFEGVEYVTYSAKVVIMSLNVCARLEKFTPLCCEVFRTAEYYFVTKRSI